MPIDRSCEDKKETGDCMLYMFTNILPVFIISKGFTSFHRFGLKVRQDDEQRC